MSNSTFQLTLGFFFFFFLSVSCACKLKDGKKSKHIHTWAEVYLQGKWIPVDIENKWFGRLPKDLLILYRGDGSFMTASEKKRFLDEIQKELF